MPRFFISENQINGKLATITGEDARHIGRSLRMKTGDSITLVCNGTEHLCEISHFSETEVSCNILKSQPGETEPNIHLTLFQAMPKSDKLETIVQKSVELGVGEIVPVITARCISRPDFKSFEKKRQRLNKISLEASKQCGRCVIPQVKSMVDFSQAVKLAGNMDKKLICYEKGGINLQKCGLASNEKIALFIGSEGGFEQSEVDFCKENGFVAVGLGKRILRCETAPIVAQSVIMNITGNL